MKFTKMQGCGNDYIFVNGFLEQIAEEEKTAQALSDRHFGVGADGMILIGPSETADFSMSMYNADGSAGEMCGNGIRCLGKYVYEKGLTAKTELAIETGAGLRHLWLKTENGRVRRVVVDMGEHQFLRKERLEVLGEEYGAVCLSMGNPHAVVFVKETGPLNLRELGPAFEYHPLFPDRVNTEFVEILSDTRLRLRVWERGSEETLACGTGACAAVVAAVTCGYTKERVTVILPGGELLVSYDRSSKRVRLEGPAETVFEGEWEMSGRMFGIKTEADSAIEGEAWSKN